MELGQYVNDLQRRLVESAATGNENTRAAAERLVDGMDAFSSSDFSTWGRILELEGVRGAEQMLADVEQDSSRRALVQDYSGLRSLCRKLDVENSIDIDWD